MKERENGLINLISRDPDPVNFNPDPQLWQACQSANNCTGQFIKTDKCLTFRLSNDLLDLKFVLLNLATVLLGVKPPYERVCPPLTHVFSQSVSISNFLFSFPINQQYKMTSSYVNRFLV